MAEFYNYHTAMYENAVPLETMFRLSREVSDEMPDYRHSEYQSAIAGIISHLVTNFTIVISPTGSGKTWIQGLVAKYFCSQGKRVTVVEPNDALCA